MKILFIGCVESSKILLESLLNVNANIVGVLTKKESNFNSDFYDVGKYCEENNLNYKYINNINDDDSINYIKSKNPDIIYCFGWSQIIQKKVIDLASKGVIGFHPTTLPQNRGRHPIIWALVLGLSKTSSTFFYIDEGADTGDIISQEEVIIDYYDDARSLYNKVMEKAIIQVQYITYKLENNTCERVKQLDEGANYWRKRNKEDGKIDWRMSSRGIYNLVRGLTRPYLGAHFIYKGNDIKVWKVEEVKIDNTENIEYGKVIEVYSNNSFLVKAGENFIKVIECDYIELNVGEYI